MLSFFFFFFTSLQEYWNVTHIRHLAGSSVFLLIMSLTQRRPAFCWKASGIFFKTYTPSSIEGLCVGCMAKSEFKCLIFCRSLYDLVVAFHVNAARDRERDIKLPASNRWTATCLFCVKPENVPVGSCWCLRDNTYTSISLTLSTCRKRQRRSSGNICCCFPLHKECHKGRDGNKTEESRPQNEDKSVA